MNFHEVAQKEIPITTWNDRDGVMAYELEFEPVSARYVELVVEGYDLPEDHNGFGNPAWLFVDEIEVW